MLGSFWTIVWFIRSYVEPPRVTISPAMALAARESTPVAPARADSAPRTITAAEASRLAPVRAGNGRSGSGRAARAADQPRAANAIADRWAR